jgi:TPR repeat protein
MSSSRFGLVLFIAPLVLAVPVTASSRPKRPAPACAEREPCRKACAAGDLDACFQLGQDLLVKGNGSAARDPIAASGVFLAACEKGHAGACLELGRLRTQGLGGPIDLEAAAAAAREACNRRLEPACAIVALDALFATGQRRDPGLAHTLAKQSEAATRKGCASNDGMLCALLAELADAGLIAGGAAAAHGFYEQAHRLLEPRCARDDGIACLWLSKGESQAATTALRRACELGVTRACSGLGGRLLYGLGVDRDATQAIATWKAACAGNDRSACQALCTRFWSGQNVTRDEPAARPFCERALALTTRSCDLGSGEGCATLALFYQDGVAVAVDRERATALSATALEALRSECKGHRSSSCTFLIRLYGHGPGAPKDLAAMLEAERLGCASGAAPACLLYAERLRAGDLVERSNERAKFYDEQACDLGNTAGCTAAAMSPTIAQKQPSPPVPCPPDQTAEEDSPNHCCFARQVWSDKDRRCLGDPLCPEGTIAEQDTCRGAPEPREAGEPNEPIAPRAANLESPVVAEPQLRQARVEQLPTPAPPAVNMTAAPAPAAPPSNCSGCAAECAPLTARCQTSMPACYESAACLCRCQRNDGGCGMPLASLDQCISDNTTRATANDRVK